MASWLAECENGYDQHHCADCFQYHCCDGLGIFENEELEQL